MSTSEEVGKTTRSGALKRFALLAGGAAGLGAIGGKVLGQQRAAVPAAVPAASGRKTKSVVLYGRDWRHVVHDAEPGKLPSATAARTPTGRIHDAGGRELGAFSAANLAGTGGVLQLQTFDLVDGESVGYGAIVLRRRAASNWVRELELPAGRLSPAAEHVGRLFAAADLDADGGASYKRAQRLCDGWWSWACSCLFRTCLRGDDPG